MAMQYCTTKSRHNVWKVNDNNNHGNGNTSNNGNSNSNSKCNEFYVTHMIITIAYVLFAQCSKSSTCFNISLENIEQKSLGFALKLKVRARTRLSKCAHLVEVARCRARTRSRSSQTFIYCILIVYVCMKPQNTKTRQCCNRSIYIYLVAVISKWQTSETSQISKWSYCK